VRCTCQWLYTSQKHLHMCSAARSHFQCATSMAKLDPVSVPLRRLCDTAIVISRRHVSPPTDASCSGPFAAFMSTSWAAAGPCVSAAAGPAYPAYGLPPALRVRTSGGPGSWSPPVPVVSLFA